MALRVLGVIPARYASTRFPGKPLTMIGQRSMIQCVYEQAKKCDAFLKVLVATDDQRIYDHVLGFGGEAMMTSTEHKSGTERIGEVVSTLRTLNLTYDVVVNIQGDEPLLDPAQIESLLHCFSVSGIEISTLIKEIKDYEDIINPNVVKVVTTQDGLALYFSRSPIPYVRDYKDKDWLLRARFFKHLGLYAYRSDILEKIVKLNLSVLEKAESLEQLRWLENGFRINVVHTDIETIAIDTPEDLLKLTNKI